MPTGLIITWVAVTTAVVLLAYHHMTLDLHDISDLQLAMEDGLDPNEVRRSSRITSSAGRRSTRYPSLRSTASRFASAAHRDTW